MSKHDAEPSGNYTAGAEIVGRIPKSMLRLQRNPKVECLMHDDDGYWIYLRYGFYYDDPGLHIIHEDSAAACVREFKSIKPCSCADCASHVAGGAK